MWIMGKIIDAMMAALLRARGVSLHVGRVIGKLLRGLGFSRINTNSVRVEHLFVALYFSSSTP